MSSQPDDVAAMARPEPLVTEEEMLGRLEAMVPSLRQRSAETETLRHLPQATIDEAIATGFVGAFRPRRFGGSGLGLSTLANGARILAHGCGSSAWTIVFLAQHAWVLGRMPEEFQQDLMGGGKLPLTAGALARVGTAKKVDGGYLVSGRVDWNSGIHHAEWTSVKAIINDQLHVCYIPVADTRRDDGWHTSGMRGTSSDAFVATDVFVPEHRAVSAALLAQVNPDPHIEAEPFLAYPYLQTVAITCSAVVLGMAEAAVELFGERIKTRVLAFSGEAKQVDQPFAQMRLGEVILRLRMARELWDATIRKLDEISGEGAGLNEDQRIDICGSCAIVVQTCRDLVNHLMNSAGGSSYFLDSPLQRIQRDVEVLKSHAFFDWDRVAQLRGKITLGIAPNPTDLF